MESTPLEQLQTFVAQLLSRHRAIRQHEDEDLSLVYADSLLLHARVRPHLNDFPPQVVVIGPTQSGKSTVANLLLGGKIAESSPLAGYTRHAQGFSSQEVDASLQAGTDSLLPGLHRIPAAELNNDQLDRYTLEAIEDARPFTDPVVTWDTPDFDSVSSRSYRSTVPMLCAIADLIVLVVSKDKYADYTVWETLRLIGPINRPLLVCLNKTPAESRDELSGIVASKFNEEAIEYTAITALPYLAEADFETFFVHPNAEQLRTLATENLPESERLTDLTTLQHFIQAHWDDWTGQLQAEQQAQAHWEKLVTKNIKLASQRYERDYLRDPHYGDTLQQAIAKLLDLLELPGIASALAKARQTITWPVRSLVGFIKKQPLTAEVTPTIDHETQALQEGIAHTLLQLQRTAGEQSTSAADDARLWWQQLWQTLQATQSELEQSGHKTIKTHQSEFAPEINRAAESLYAHLQEHPITLNGLRATRATTDAAAVVFALKTGGIGLSDLVFAPAMLTFTSMLTESAVGRYMKTVEEKLRNSQLASARQHVFAQLQQQLTELPMKMDHNGLYALPADDLKNAQKALQALAS